MVNSMHSFGDMPESNDSHHSYLADSIERFKACEKRAFQQVPDGQSPQPDPEKDTAMSLEEYKGTCREADLETLLPDKQTFLSWIQNASHKDLSQRYPTGQRVCLALVPQLSGGEPTIRFYQLYVNAKGLTYGYTPDPGYYYRLLPEELQQSCTFQVPFYENMHYPSDAERKTLIDHFSQAYDNLLALLS